MNERRNNAHLKGKTMKSTFILAFLGFSVLVGVATTGHAQIGVAPFFGFDWPADDFDSHLAGSQANCAANCLERANCSAATFDHDDGRCWMKTSAPNMVRTANSTLLLKVVVG
jgi:hypothetical protein